VNKNKIVALFVALICICLAAVFFFKDFFMPPAGNGQRTRTSAEISYNADAEIAAALEQMKQSQDKATVITNINSNQREIALTFDGVTDRTKMQQIVELLKKYNAKATFFVTGSSIAEEPKIAVNINKEGYKIENNTLLGMATMENVPVEQLIKDFCRAQKIIQVTTDRGANLLKCNDTKYTEQLLQVARACGFNSVVKSDLFLDVKQISSLSAADEFVAHIRPGSIVSVKLQPNGEPVQHEEGKTNLTPAVDKKPGLRTLPQQADLEDKELVAAVEKLLIALQKANYATVYVEDFSQKQSSALAKSVSFVQEQVLSLFTCRAVYAAESVENKADEIKVISTTEPALSYIFAGLTNEFVVNDVLGRLDHLKIKATFFVTETEMKKYPTLVRKLIESGHEIGIGIRPKSGETLDETSNNIVRSRQMLQEQFGVTTNLVKQLTGVIEDTTKKAVSNVQCILISQSINVVQSKHKEYTSADQVMAEIFPKSMYAIGRGQIVYFRMDYYTNNQLVGDLLEAIKQRKVDNIAYTAFYDNPEINPANDSQYMIKPIGEILNNKKYTYQYPVDLSKVPEHLQIHDKGLNIDESHFLSESAKRYIGNEDVRFGKSMLGFSKMEDRHLDKKGYIHTTDNVIFITFDDWGTDASVNKILYVLRKHHIPATFFILTHNVLNNPNLLRSIAAEGNVIGSHSNEHKPMAIIDHKTGQLVKTQDREEYMKDLATAYQKLQSITGDVTLNGKPVLTRYFRPPTLAISKMGFESLFENGYEYIINGSFNTGDYAAKSVEQLVKVMEEGIYTQEGGVQKGAVLVMHMLDTAAYTPLALDIVLTANEKKSDSDPSKFKVGRLSDYLVDGYAQMNH